MIIPFVADSDSDFLELRCDVRADINVAESEFRAAMQELLDRFPPELVGNLGAIVVDTPARFIRGLLPFFIGLSAMRNEAEALQWVILKQRTAGLN